MNMDEELFFARRLGLGLKKDEFIGGPVRDWALAQLKDIPPLDFYGPDGTSIRAQLADESELLTDFEQACKAWEVSDKTDETVSKEARNMSGQQADDHIFKNYVYPWIFVPRWRDCLAKTLTAVNGPSPVFERFWMFWLNHFTVSTTEVNIKVMYGAHTRNIRKRLTGNFSDLLHDAILNPAMLAYLDNVSSTGPNSQSGKQNDGNLNENLAREVLELHTMSPAAGYTQKDVIEAALALTGWQYYAATRTHGRAIKGAKYGTWFQRERHEPGTRTVLGKKYKSGNKGADQAPAMLNDFAASEETAKFLSFKLARHFVADSPPADSVARIVEAWLDSKGDLPTIHMAVVDEVLAKALDHRKFTTPENWLLQAYRMVGVQPPATQPIWGLESIHWTFAEVGQAYDQCPQPNGWSDLQSDWISKELLDRRIRLAYSLGQTVPGPEAQTFNAYAIAYAARLSGTDSELTAKVAAATPPESAAMILSSPEFLKI